MPRVDVQMVTAAFWPTWLPSTCCSKLSYWYHSAYRVTATKFMVLEDGGQLPAVPFLTHLVDNTHLVDKDYGVYERDVNNWEGESAAAACKQDWQPCCAQ